MLTGLATLDAETARALADFKGTDLWLDGLTTLDTETAKALADFKGDQLQLYGLTTLDAETAKALAKFKGDRLQLYGLTTLDADTAKALAEFAGVLGLREHVLQAFLAKNPLTPDTALAWAKSMDGNLSVVTALGSADTAKALADFKGNWLRLNGLTTLDADTAKALADFKGRLSLAGLTALDADMARALAAAEKWDGWLRQITALDSPDSVAIAHALATRKGPLSLPNLKKISPKALAALLKKKDVDIPLIETLELIQEPDGSVTEEFIVPEWLSERERRIKDE